MTLHIFNPEHDHALASGLANFTAPHAGRQLRHDMGWLPALWAEESDAILVDDAVAAQSNTARRQLRCRRFVGYRDVASLGIDRIEPWGWNNALCARLSRAGIDEALIPGKEQIDTIRQLSHRRTAAKFLSQLRIEGTIGDTTECQSVEEILQIASRHERLVMKAPWSSSGRGVRFVSAEAAGATETAGNSGIIGDKNLEGWLRNVLQRQGSVMVEPYYNKVKDFGMEFYSDGKGTVSYLGLSLFHTANGAYTGNCLATEQTKRNMLSRYVSPTLLDEMQLRISKLLGIAFNGKYEGPFGIDMMVVRPQNSNLKPQTSNLNSQTSNLLHPCVEMNLRRTMGHVALEAERLYNPDQDGDIRHVMRIDYMNNNYKLHIKRL